MNLKSKSNFTITIGASLLLLMGASTVDGDLEIDSFSISPVAVSEGGGYALIGAVSFFGQEVLEGDVYILTCDVSLPTEVTAVSIDDWPIY